MSKGGVIRLLDQIKTYPFPNFSLWQILAILAQVQQSTYTCKSKSMAAECKSLHMKVKGKGLERANTMYTRRFLTWFR